MDKVSLTCQNGGSNDPQEPAKLQVKIYKYLDGEQASVQSANNYEFPMSATWSWPGSPALQGSSGSGDYFLSQSGHGGSGAYQAFTSVMNAPAQYSTYEVTTDLNDESKVLPIGAQCENGKYRLLGYKVGDTLEEAEESDLVTTSPAFTNLNADKYVIVENEKCPETATVNICKVNQNDEALSGWTLMLKGKSVQNGLLVPTNVSSGVNSNLLDNGVSYLAEVLGTWLNQGGANPVDAEYSTTDGWATQMDGYTGYQSDILELQINSIFDPNSDWGAYNSSHRYAMSFVPSVDGPANFRIFDGTGTTQNEGWFGDNSGNLNVDLYEGYAGVTGENGCVTFTNVPYGEYSVDEILQDNWSNVSGLGAVTVDGAVENFEVKNTDGEVPPVQCTEGYIEVENECVLDEDDGGETSEVVEETPAPTFLPGGRRHDVSGFSSGGSVLGASTENLICEPYLNEYIKYGAQNNPEEVKKLQIFLNQFFEENNPVTGVYGPITFEMVKKFQTHQKDAILLPWTMSGLPTEDPTGYVYKTTKRWINILKCPEMIATSPFPTLP